MNIVRIGELARAALARSGGIASPLTAFAEAPYLEAAGEIIWVGARLPALHPRAVLTDAVPPRGVVLQFDSLPVQGWSRQLPVLDQPAARSVIAGVQALRQTLIREELPRGFGTLLAGRQPAFPLDLAAPRVRSLAAAYARNDPNAVVDASRALLGFGTGLTPSGDDVAGAALFGRRLVAPNDETWQSAAALLSQEVAVRSHAISAALFADLAMGQSFAPLHDTVDALAAGDTEGAHAAARMLATIGHSSGWDMLTGFVIGVTGEPGQDASVARAQSR